MNAPVKKAVCIGQIGCVFLLFVFVCGCSGNKSMGEQKKTEKKELPDIFSLLQSRIDDGIMLGHQDALAYGSMWYGDDDRSDIKSICGDHPAVVGWDIACIEKNSWLNADSIEFDKLKDYICKVNEAGGINIISWNCRDLSQNISSLLSDPVKYQKCLDKVVQFIKELKDKNNCPVPVIFRLYPDPNLSGAWWSIKNSTPEEYRKLWKVTVDYLRGQQETSRILFAFSLYNPHSEQEITGFYPGDDYTDIIGCDLYMQLNTDPEGKLYRENLDKSLSSVTSFARMHKKIPAVTHTGLQGIKIPNFFTGYVYPVISKYPISYILFGKNAWNADELYHIPVSGHPACDDFLYFANNPRILTCGKLKHTDE